MQDTQDLSQLRDHKVFLLKQLQGIGDFRQGSLVERFRKCGKPYCRCAKPGDPGHGPSWSLTRTINGKTVTKIIPVSAVATVKEQLAEYHHFRDTVHDLIETNVLICDAVLERTAKESDPKEAEKGGSKQ
jgi:hypothetical protein